MVLDVEKALDNAGETTVGGVLRAVDWVCKNKQKFNIIWFKCKFKIE